MSSFTYWLATEMIRWSIFVNHRAAQDFLLGGIERQDEFLRLLSSGCPRDEFTEPPQS